jgi:hypothetical protein
MDYTINFMQRKVGICSLFLSPSECPPKPLITTKLIKGLKVDQQAFGMCHVLWYKCVHTKSHFCFLALEVALGSETCQTKVLPTAKLFNPFSKFLVVEIFISPFFPINYDSNGPG